MKREPANLKRQGSKEKNNNNNQQHWVSTKQKKIRNKENKMETIIILGFSLFAVLPFAAEGIRIYLAK
jgi:hypothetical protein